MAISIDWGTKVITVPKADLTEVQLFPQEIRELDINAFRLELKDLEDSDEGMAFPATHNHNTTVTLSGITFAHMVEIINGYTVTFEDGQYAVKLAGANSNIADVTNVNQVSVRPANSAGLIQVDTGGGSVDIAAIVTAVWAKLGTSGRTTMASLEQAADKAKDAVDGLAPLAAALSALVQYEEGRWKIDADTKQMTFYAADGTTPLRVFDLFDRNGDPSVTEVFERVPV